MVKTEFRTVWKCPYCGEEYEDPNNAWDCAKECIDIDAPEEVDKEIFICEFCGEIHDDILFAEACEEKHSVNQDKYWQQHLAKADKEKLEQVSFLPGQKRLNTIF